MASALERLRGERGVYELGEVVGSGGFAEVFRGRDVASATDVAIKVLRGDLITQIARDRFRREVAALRRLGHPGIVPLLDAGEWRGRPFLIMPWLAGTALGDMMKREGPLDAPRVAALATAIGEALSHAHAAGVVHRDITPSNILWSKDRWWLVDFGLAIDAGADADTRLTSTGTVVGTSAYMSPEQVAGARDIDARSDQYSLACVLYEALAGVAPFVAASPQASRAMRLHAEPSDLKLHRPGLPDGMRRAVRRALSREPADRFPSIAEFLGAFLSRETPQQPAWPVRRARWLVGLAVATAAALASVARPWRSTAAEPLATAPNPRHVAVRFFEDLTPDSSLRWLAQGITRDLIHELSRLDTLRVVSASRVESFRDPALSSDSVARALGVGTLIEGTVRVKRATQVEVLVQLIDASNGYRVRSWSFEHPLSEALTMVDELQFTVSAYLREHVGGAVRAFERRSRVTSVDAWRLVQEADDILAEGTRVARHGSSVQAWRLLDRADALLARATQLAPGWPDPWILRARAARAAFTGLTLTDPVPGQGPGSAGMVETGVRKLTVGQQFADRALQLSAESAEGRTLKAYFHFMRWQIRGQVTPSADLDTAEALVRQVVRQDPGQALAWVLLSRVHRFRGEGAQADSTARRAFAADPFLSEARRAIADLVNYSLESGRVAEARALCEETRERYRDDREVPECRLVIMGWIAAGRDSVEAAWRELREMERAAVPAASTSWTMRRMYVAMVAARSRMTDSAYAIVRRAYAERGPNRADSVRAAMAEVRIRALAGDSLAAQAKFDSLIRSTESQRARIETHPWIRSFAQTSSR